MPRLALSFPLFRPFKWLKAVLPRSLFGRSLIILVTPLIIVQVVLSYIFFERHTDTILKVLADSIAGDIQSVTEMVEQNLNQRPTTLPPIIDSARKNLRLEITLAPRRELIPLPSAESDWVYGFMVEALQEKLERPYRLRIDSTNIYVDVQLPDATLEFVTLRKRLFSRTTPLVIIWTTTSALLLFLVASLFMRNQIRPLRRLADAAEKFGKGQDVGNFRPEGASEVRKAGHAFNIMRDRIQRQMQERTEMLAGVSHDLRTPLTRIKLQLALMRTRSEAIKNLARDAEQMQQMVEGFLAFARTDQDHTSQLTNLYALFKEIILPFDQNVLKIFMDCSPNLTISLNPILFKRCLTNLLLNSQRYAQTVWLKARQRARIIEITLDDDGPGILEKDREDVFRPFFRLDRSRNPDTGGVGLGLSIARDVIHRHGGIIKLLDAPRGGLRVLIRLPR